MTQLIQKIEERFQLIAHLANELNSRRVLNRDIIRDLGIEIFREVQSVTDRDQFVSCQYSDLYGRPPTGAEAKAHSRALKKHEEQGLIVILRDQGPKGLKARWVQLPKVNEPKQKPRKKKGASVRTADRGTRASTSRRT